MNTNNKQAHDKPPKDRITYNDLLEKVEKGLDSLFRPFINVSESAIKLPLKNSATKIVYALFIVLALIIISKTTPPIPGIYPIFFAALWPLTFLIILMYLHVLKWFLKTCARLILLLYKSSLK